MSPSPHVYPEWRDLGMKKDTAALLQNADNGAIYRHRYVLEVPSGAEREPRLSLWLTVDKPPHSPHERCDRGFSSKDLCRSTALVAISTARSSLKRAFTCRFALLRNSRRTVFESAFSRVSVDCASFRRRFVLLVCITQSYWRTRWT